MEDVVAGNLGDEPQSLPNIEEHGKYTLELDRPIYYDNDAIRGTFTCEMQKALTCKRLRARVVCVYSLRVADTSIKTEILWESETTLTTNMTLQPASSTDLTSSHESSNSTGVYQFEFSFHLDSNMPNTLRVETLTCGSLSVKVSYYAEVWFESEKPGQSKDRDTVVCVLMASTRFVKGSVYVPQPETQPQASLSKTLAISGLFGGQKDSVTVTAALSKDVYSCGEPIVVSLSVDDHSNNVWAVSACIRQKFRDLPVMTSPAIGTVETSKPVSRVSNVSKYRLLVDAVLPRCNCMDRKCDLPACMEIAHIPTDGHGNMATLAPTTIIDQSSLPGRDPEDEDDAVGNPVIEYVVEVKVSIRKSRSMNLCLGFVMTNDTLVYTMNHPEPAFRKPVGVVAAAMGSVMKRRVSESMAATWVMPTPFIRDGLPSYDQAKSGSVVDGLMRWFGLAQADGTNEPNGAEEDVSGTPPSYDEIERYMVLHSSLVQGSARGKEQHRHAHGEDAAMPVAVAAGGL